MRTDAADSGAAVACFCEPGDAVPIERATGTPRWRLCPDAFPMPANDDDDLEVGAVA